VLDAQFATEAPAPKGLRARRQAALAERIGRRSDWRSRLENGGRPLAADRHLSS
jgi:hypothetical protein